MDIFDINDMDPNARFLTPREVARLLHVSPITVRSWANKGLLRTEITPGGHRRFSFDEVERLAGEHGMTLELQPATTQRVLIVDDDRQFSGYLVELLEGLPSPPLVEVAHDGFEAGRRLMGMAPDIVLLDLMMPGMDGFETCRRIKEDSATSHVRVIAISGYPTPESVRRILDCGAERCLGKPLDARQLLQAMTNDR